MTRIRNRTSISRVFFVAMAILFVCFSMPAGSGCKAKKAEVVKIPDLVLKNTEGVDVSLKDFAGDVLLVNFWATWCYPCKIEIPELIDLYKRHKNKGLTILGIAVDDSGTEFIKEFAQSMKINYPVLIGDETVPDQFGGIVGFPTTLVIAKDGTVYNRYLSIPPRSLIERDIQYLLGEKL